MADEDLAVEGDGAQVEVTEGAAQQDETPEPIANLARDLGWTPREEWEKAGREPEKWKPAEQFIRDGRDIQQSLKRKLDSFEDQFTRMGAVTDTLLQEKLAERDAEWQSRMSRAVEDGDTETALKLADQRPKLPAVDPAPDATVHQWVAKNPWFTNDPLAEARARELSERLKHLPVPDQLAQVERAIRKEFPEHFPAPTKTPPATQTGAARSTGTNNRIKGFADMPAASQQIALDYEKRLGVPKEKTAQSYWADQEGVSR